MLAAWVGFTGGAFLETGYDPDPQHGMRPVQMEQCGHCGAQQAPGLSLCEACGYTDTLEPITLTVPIGKMFTEVAPLFEMYFDPSITDWAQHRRVLREKCAPVDDAKARWPQIADQISANVAGSAEEHYMSALSVQGPALDERGTGRRDMAPVGLLTNNRVTERW